MLATDDDGHDDVLVADGLDAAIAAAEAILPRGVLTDEGRLPKNYRVIPFPDFAKAQGDDGDAEKNRIEQNRAEKDAQGDNYK